MTRKEAREAGFIIIFEHKFQPLTAASLLELYYAYKGDPGNQKDYLENLVRTTIDHLNEIDALIEKYAEGWTVSRLSRVSLAALRIGICELMYDENIPDSIAINEAVQLTKDYETEKAASFVNGILGAVVRARD